MARVSTGRIELLAPARDLSSAIAAIECGADAIYIGAEKFSARAKAGNSFEDIKTLVLYAHKFRVKVYIALNTIFTDSEMEEVKRYIERLYEIGVDALIIQDMGVLELDLPPIRLFASTQTNNASWERVKFLEEVGFKRAILARELSLKEISEIRKHTALELECFIPDGVKPIPLGVGYKPPLHKLLLVHELEAMTR